MSEQAKGYPHTMQAHGRVLRGNPPRSISDDDLCATCAKCIDHPRGDLSIRSEGWPTIINPDGYITECAQHLQQDYAGQNLPITIWLQQQVATMPVETITATK